MGHLYGDPIEVRGADGAVVSWRPNAPTVSIPASFLWRGRVYLVRAVLAQWRERLPWWASSAARLARGDLPADLQEGSEGRAAESDGWLQSFRGTRADDESRSARVPALPGSGTPLSFEQEVWRVEAGCGRQSPVGVYDLCREVTTPVLAAAVSGAAGLPVPSEAPILPGASTSSWRLLRICD